MEQRRVRLGDIVDDYCTRERRVTNHAVVAMIEDQIHLTRCTTCDTEHAYKAARVPRRRKKTDTGALYDQVLAGREPDGAAGHEAPNETRHAPPGPEAEPGEVTPPVVHASADDAPADGDTPLAAADDEAAGPLQEDGAVRRPLIRATLPRPEGQPTVRQPPEFTIRQSGGRGGFRQEARGGHRNGRPAGGPGRGGAHDGAHGGHERHGQRSGFGHGRSGSPQGGRPDRQPGQARHNRPPQHARSGKKRSH